MNVRTTLERARFGIVTLIVGGLLVGGAVGCSGTSDECGADSDCKQDRLCEDGVCVEPSDSTDDSNTDDDTNDDTNSNTTYCCTQGEAYECPVDSCRNAQPGDCTRAASRDSQCSTDQVDDMGDVCDTDGQCSEVCVHNCIGICEGICSKQCEDWSDCPLDWKCKEVHDMSGKFCVQN